jgi:hypothetical protein
MLELQTRQNSIAIQVVSPTDSDWQELLDTIPYDFYHLPGYLALEATRYNAIPEAIIIKDDGKVFFLPYSIRDCSHLLNSSNYQVERVYDIVSPYGYPGILVNQAGQNPEFIKKCLNLAHSYWQGKNICSAFIRLHPILNSYIDNSIYSSDKFILCSQGDVVTCDLSKDIKEIYKQIRSNHRNKISKLNRCECTVEIVPADRKHLDAFMDIYQETMQRVNASNAYYFTRDYFESLVQVLGDRLNICTVAIDGQIIASGLITELNGIVQYHLSGTKTMFVKQSPTTIMIKYVIEWAKQRNNKYLNLGGGLGGSRDSLYYFKSGFSNEVKHFTTIKTIVDRENYHRLITARAEYLGVSSLDIENTSFFPAYRSP